MAGNILTHNTLPHFSLVEYGFGLPGAQVLSPFSTLENCTLWPILSSTDIVFCGLSLSITNVVAGPALLILVMIARCPSTITIRKLNKGLLLARPRNYPAHLRPQSKVMSRERENTWAGGSAFTEVKRGGLGFHRLTLYWWI